MEAEPQDEVSGGEVFTTKQQYQTMVRKQRCNECAGCRATECGTCKFCVNMRKFGGPGTLKQPCVQRKCTGEVFSSTASPITDFYPNHLEKSSPRDASSKQQTQQETKSGDKGSTPFVDNVAETGYFSALSTIKPINMRNGGQSQAQDSASNTNAQGTAANKTEVEIFEPYDPSVGGEILDRVNIGYDSNAAAYFSSLESGTVMSRCECMASNTVKYTPRADLMGQGGLGNPNPNSITDLRASVIASVKMEKGVRAMDMAPLPTYIYGEGILGNPIPLNLQTTLSSSQGRESRSESRTREEGGGTSSSSSGPPAPAPNRRAYGGHFKPPKPFRNEQGELIIKLHLSRMLNVTLASLNQDEDEQPFDALETTASSETAVEVNSHPNIQEEGSLLEGTAPTASEVSSSLPTPEAAATSPVVSTGNEGGGMVVQEVEPQEEQEEQVSALDRLKNRGRKRKVPPTVLETHPPPSEPETSNGF